MKKRIIFLLILASIHLVKAVVFPGLGVINMEWSEIAETNNFGVVYNLWQSSNNFATCRHIGSTTNTYYSYTNNDARWGKSMYSLTRVVKNGSFANESEHTFLNWPPTGTNFTDQVKIKLLAAPVVTGTWVRVSSDGKNFDDWMRFNIDGTNVLVEHRSSTNKEKFFIAYPEPPNQLRTPPLPK